MEIFRKATFASLLTTALLIVGLTPATSAAANNPWDADDCTVVVDNTGQVILRWTPGTSADNHDVWRNGRRIAMTGSSVFRDVYPPEGVVHYSVAGRSGSRVQEPREYCGKVELDGSPITPPPAPATCQAVQRDGTFIVSWDSVPEADKYVVSRSVNGSRFYWRGRVSETSFTDSGRSGAVTYQVVSRSASGLRGLPVECTSGDEPPATDCRTQITMQEARALALPRPPVVNQAILDQLPPSVDSAFVAPDGWVYYVAAGDPDLDYLERIDLANGVTERLNTLGVLFRTYRIQHVDSNGSTYVAFSDKTQTTFTRYDLNGDRVGLGSVDSVGLGTNTQAYGDIDDGRTVLVTETDSSITAIELYDPVTEESTVLPFVAGDQDFIFGLTADGDLVGGSGDLVADIGFRFDLSCAVSL